LLPVWSPTSISYSFVVFNKSRNSDFIQLTGSADTRGHLLVDLKALFYLTTRITPHSDCFVWPQAGRSERRNCSVSWIAIHAFQRSVLQLVSDFLRTTFKEGAGNDFLRLAGARNC